MATKVVPITELRNRYGYPTRQKPGMFRSYREAARFALWTMAMGVIFGAVAALAIEWLVSLWS